jgi:hypothetical protein
MTHQRLIITGACAAFGPSLLAMLGSLDANWPGHPPVLVYDLGLDAPTLAALARHDIPVRRVPPFCPHWRQHFTWKPWCWCDAPARQVFWLDAGLVVLAPLDEAFLASQRLGYFLVPTYHLLNDTATEAACEGCGDEPPFRNGKPIYCGGIFAFARQGPAEAVVTEVLRVAQTQRYIAATHPRHKHDQARLSLLMHRRLAPLAAADGAIYGGWESPTQVRPPPGSAWPGCPRPCR